MSKKLLNAARECLADLEHYVSTHGEGPDHRLAALKKAIAEAEEGYNGWENYETLLLGLWLGSEELTQQYWANAAQEAIDSATASEYLTREQEANRNLENRLKSEIENGGLDVTGETGLYADLLGAALGSVNYREIADKLLEGVKAST
jgi:hypothetical protein